jgi:Holliday junction resolvase RusA-like endonuclease
MIQLNLDGNPIPWKRPGGTRIRYDTQAKEKEQIRWYLRSQLRGDPLSTPLMVDIIFYFPVPKHVSSVKKKEMLNNMIHHMKRPDVDNCAKFILDCMNGVVFVDDSQIADLHARKQYSMRPGTYIRVIPLNLKQELEKEIDNEGNPRDS